MIEILLFCHVVEMTLIIVALGIIADKLSK